jgi:hypothetical protein
MSKPQILFCGSDKQYLAEELTKASNSANGGNAFRIPSIVNANGTLVAVVDRAGTGNDWGYIELAVRTSDDGGETWSDIKTVVAPPARETSGDSDNTKTAFFIDPCMAVAPNGDVVLIATFFPESKGLFDKKLLKSDSKKLAYATFDGEKTQLIYDNDGNYYMVLADGSVLDGKSKAKTDYSLKGLGNLYKKDEYVGNIYLNSAVGKALLPNTTTTFGAPLKAPKRSYIFMLKSSDNGKTWSEPKDITPSIIDEEKDGFFFAVAPGSGLTTQKGRVIMPIYTLHGTVAIYSDDNGETWQRNSIVPYTQNIDEWSAVQAPTGEIYSFGRAKKFGKTPVSISTNNGTVFLGSKKVKVKAPKCQKNSLAVGNKVLISHPSAKKRANGVISVGTFNYNKKGKLKGIKWSKEDIKLNEGFFAYSCMAKIDDNTVAVLYEDQPGSHIIFDKVKI